MCVETTEVVDTLKKDQGDILEVVFARFREITWIEDPAEAKQFHDDLCILVKAVKRMYEAVRHRRLRPSVRGMAMAITTAATAHDTPVPERATGKHQDFLRKQSVAGQILVNQTQ